MAGKIQNEDHKSLSELQALGADKPQLLNTDKIYVPKAGITEVLETILRKNNDSSIVDPSASDDLSLGYEVGSRWVNTASGKAFTCVDSSAGLAVWKQGGSGGSGKLNFISIGTQEEANLSDYTLGNSVTFADPGAAALSGAIDLSNVSSFRGLISLKYTNHAIASNSNNDFYFNEAIIPAGYQRESLLDFSFQYSSDYLDGNARIKLVADTGEVLIDEILVKYVDAVNSSEFKRRILIKAGVTSIKWGAHIVNGESSSIIKMDDVVLTPEIGFVEQNIITQEADSYIRLSGLVTRGTAAGNTVLSLANTQDLAGSAISYVRDTVNGDTFTINEDGIYNLSANLLWDSTSSAGYHGFTKNQTNLSDVVQSLPEANRLSIVSDSVASFGGGTTSATTYLKKGDVVRWVTGDISKVINVSTAYTTLSITKAGSVVQYPALKDQKIIIPTSEIRMEGASVLGTWAEADTVKWPNLIKIYGDAISLNNDIGTIITILKDGIATISVGLGGGGTTSITRNQVNNAVPPLASEILLADTPASNISGSPFTWSGLVFAGDKIRVSTNSLVSNPHNKLSIVHQVQDVNVSVNTVIPQFEDTDSMVRLTGASGQGSVNTAIRRFSSVASNLGSAITYVPSTTDGDSFIIQEDGIFHITYTEQHSSASSATFGMSLNSNQLSTALSLLPGIDRLAQERISGSNGLDYQSCSWSGKLVKGDIVRAHTSTSTPPDGTILNAFTIAKQANPSVVGIDGNPTVVFKEGKLQIDSLEFTDLQNTFQSFTGNLRFPTSLNNTILSSGKLLDIVDTGSETRFTAKSDLIINMSGSLAMSGSTIIRIFKNGLEVMRGSDAFTNSAYSNSSVEVHLQEGEYLTLSGTILNNASVMFLAISATSTKETTLYNVPVTGANVTIPTSELKMLGTTGRGSTTETSTVLYANLDLITGEALSVDNSNGTVITVLKDGIVDVNGSVKTTGPSTIYISKNTLNAAAVPILSEIEGLHSETTAGYWIQASAKFSVKIGDKIRISYNTSITAQPQGNFSILHTENNTEIKISNVEPQFEDFDSMIRLSNSINYGSINTMIQRWSNVISRVGDAIKYVDSATLGASFIAQKEGSYYITFTANQVSQNYFGLSLNSTQLTSAIVDINVVDRLALSTTNGDNLPDTVSWSGYLKKGDVVRCHTSGITTASLPQRAQFTMSYAGKPSIIGADLTAFVNVEKQVSQSITHQSPSNTLLNLVGETRFNVSNLLSSGSGIIRIEDDVANARTNFVITKDCLLNISWSAQSNAASISYIYKSGLIIQTGTNAYTATAVSHVSTILKAKKGDVYSVGHGPIFSSADSNSAQLSIVATADAVETISETSDIFDTDTAELTFSSTPLDGTEAIGTFNTYQYNASSNVSIIQGSAPAQAVQDMNRDGILMSARAFNGGFQVNPPRVDIQIGKGHVDYKLSSYFGTSKDLPMTIESGTNFVQTTLGVRKSYNEKTGVLTISTGYAFSGAETFRVIGMDVVNNIYRTTGYMVIRASRKLPLVSIPGRKVVVVKDVKPQGTAGGTFTNGAWRQRDLNTLEGDTTFMSLIANQITLDPGNYNIYGSAPVHDVDQHVVKLFDFTNSLDKIIGTGSKQTSTENGQGESFISGSLQVLQQTTYEVRHKCTTTKVGVGFGDAHNLSQEVYTQITIEKLS